MAKNDNVQLRGNCCHCGRDQAVVGNVMADHGYTLEHHWRQGACSGSRDKPMQGNPLLALDVQDALRKLADKHAAMVFEAPDKVMVKRARHDKEAEYKGWAELAERDQKAYRANWEAKRDFIVRDIRGVAEYLQKLAAVACYEPLREVLRKADPVPIRPGDRKLRHSDQYGQGMQPPILTVKYVDRGRVHWVSDNGKSGWTGTQAWRKWADAPAAEGGAA